MKRHLLKLLIVCMLSGLCACADAGNDEPTPEAAKEFLKLRGYTFDEKSFLSAAAAGDMIAIRGFMTAGINRNARDDNGDTALTAAAARGDLKVVNALLQGGADVNAKGRNEWTAFLLALQGERDEVADVLLVQQPLDLSAETPNGMTAL